MVPVDQVTLLEGEKVEKWGQVPAVVNLVPDESSPLLRLGLHDAVGEDPGGGLAGVAHLERVATIVKHQGVAIGSGRHGNSNLVPWGYYNNMFWKKWMVFFSMLLLRKCHLYVTCHKCPNMCLLYTTYFLFFFLLTRGKYSVFISWLLTQEQWS